MTRLRFWMSMLVLWLTLLFNIERLFEPFNISSFVYIVAAVLAVCMVVFPPLPCIRLAWVFFGVTGLLVIAKGSLGYQITGRALPLTVTEVVVVYTTILLARQIALSIRQFEESVCEIAGLQWVQQSLPFKDSWREFYSEVRRARRYNRPVALLALKPLIGRPTERLSRLVDEIHRKVAQDQLDAHIAGALASHLQDCELVAKYKSEFIVLLPEADRHRAHKVAEDLAAQIRQVLGAEVRAGLATFPDQEITLSGLLERARAAAQTTPGETESSMACAEAGQAAPCALVVDTG